MVRIPVLLDYSFDSDDTQDAEQELPQLTAKLQSQEQPTVPAIAEGFRLAYALISF